MARDLYSIIALALPGAILQPLKNKWAWSDITALTVSTCRIWQWMYINCCKALTGGKIIKSNFVSHLNRSKSNTTSDIKNKNIWHSTFCKFLNVVKRKNWLLNQMQALFVVFKLFHYSNLNWVLPETGVPWSDIIRYHCTVDIYFSMKQILWLG